MEVGFAYQKNGKGKRNILFQNGGKRFYYFIYPTALNLHSLLEEQERRNISILCYVISISWFLFLLRNLDFDST